MRVPTPKGPTVAGRRAQLADSLFQVVRQWRGLQALLNKLKALVVSHDVPHDEVTNSARKRTRALAYSTMRTVRSAV